MVSNCPQVSRQFIFVCVEDHSKSLETEKPNFPNSDCTQLTLTSHLCELGSKVPIQHH